MGAAILGWVFGVGRDWTGAGAGVDRGGGFNNCS